MLRQRLRARGFALSHVVARVLVVALRSGAGVVRRDGDPACVQGVPDTVDNICGYRTAYDYLTGLEPDDITCGCGLTVGLGGLAVFLLFGYLAWREIPRPYLARGDLQLERRRPRCGRRQRPRRRARGGAGRARARRGRRRPRALPRRRARRSRSSPAARVPSHAVRGPRAGGGEAWTGTTCRRCPSMSRSPAWTARTEGNSHERPPICRPPGLRLRGGLDRLQLRLRACCLVGAGAFYALAGVAVGNVDLGELQERFTGRSSSGMSGAGSGRARRARQLGPGLQPRRLVPTSASSRQGSAASLVDPGQF